MPTEVPNVKLNNGQLMPIIGLGTWGSPPGEVTQAVKDAIDCGYRHIDCAHVYENEHEVGAAIKAKIEEGVITREDIFITSKLWNTFHRPDLVRGALETTLANLGLDYLDLYLIHFPTGFQEGGELFPKNQKGETAFSLVDYIDTWKEMENAVDAGLTKSIGVSNFNAKQIDRLVANARIKPVTNQVECHPYLTQVKLGEHCLDKGIVITAYSSLGSPARPWVKADDWVLMDDPKVNKLAVKYNKSPAQVLIRYQIQRGHIVLPKSVTQARIASNFDVFDFELSRIDMALLTALNGNKRVLEVLTSSTHPYYPFKDEY